MSALLNPCDCRRGGGAIVVLPRRERVPVPSRPPAPQVSAASRPTLQVRRRRLRARRAAVGPPSPRHPAQVPPRYLLAQDAAPHRRAPARHRIPYPRTATTTPRLPAPPTLPSSFLASPTSSSSLRPTTRRRASAATRAPASAVPRTIHRAASRPTSTTRTSRADVEPSNAQVSRSETTCTTTYHRTWERRAQAGSLRYHRRRRCRRSRSCCSG